ncbi:MAG: helix-turn-helix domain-containing protein [Clostridia bacterium]|nr:helix-turn-helix domain-containing protein [Clostridia bacterium]
MNDFFSYPSQEEIRRAVGICCGRFCRLCETPVEYAWRARDVDMSSLLDFAIENELTDTEREAVRLRWFENLTSREIALRTETCESSVSRTLSRAAAKLGRALGYAVFYQHDNNSSAIIPAAVERARAVSAAKFMKAEDFAGRVKKQRLIRGYSEEQTERYAGIKRGRLRRIESGETPSAEEKARLSAFFAVMPAENDE